MSATGIPIPPAPPELSPEAEAFVKAVGAAADLPAFVRNVQSIGSVAANRDARVGLLEHAIMQDVALSAKVLRIANAVTGGGGSTSSVGSVKQAIMLLGFDRVQHLSTAASVFEQLDQDAPSVRDLMVEAVLAANHSLHLSFAAGHDRPELAYLCGLFRRFGELLVACYRPRPYRAWLERVQADGPTADGAEARQFGFTFEEVGIALAKRWGMPGAVVRTMRTYRGVSLEGETLHAVTQCSAELARCLYGASSKADGAAAHEIRTRFAPLIGLDVTTMQECMIAAIADAKPTLGTMHVDLEVWLRGHADATAVALMKRERADGSPAAGERGETALAPAEAEALQAAIDRLAPNPNDSAQEARLRDVVRALVQQREQQREQQQGEISVGSVTDSTLRAACEAGYERGVLGISSEDFKLIRGRVGIGRGSAELARNFLLRPSGAFGPLGAALHVRSDLFIEMTGADAKQYGRDRLIKDLSPSNFALLPLVLEMKLIGCLYFDSTIESVHSTETSRQLLCDLRDHLVAAFAHHRASVSEPAAGAA